jgi:four helix bundle protein
MKRQAPTSKHQRNPKGCDHLAAIAVDYPGLGWQARDWVLNEDPPAVERHPFDLEERTALFGEAVIRFLKKVPRGPNNDRLIDQMTGCSTSVGANYCEANEGLSKKDFRNIIGRCRKEARESKFFLRMIAASEPTLTDEARALYREAKELHLIFCSIYRKTG